MKLKLTLKLKWYSVPVAAIAIAVLSTAVKLLFIFCALFGKKLLWITCTLLPLPPRGLSERSSVTGTRSTVTREGGQRQSDESN